MSSTCVQGCGADERCSQTSEALPAWAPLAAFLWASASADVKLVIWMAQPVEGAVVWHQVLSSQGCRGHQRQPAGGR